MSLTHRLASFATLAIILAQPAFAQDDSEMSSKEYKVREYLKLTGAEALSHQMIEQTVASMAAIPGLHPDFPQEFRNVAAETSFTDMTVPVYLEHLTEEDVDAAIAYWSSPAGQRMAAATPVITQQSMAIGQAWGAQVGEEAMRRIQAR
jgi:hypothetical protein